MNLDPLFLTLGEVLEIHSYQIKQFGGSAEILSKEKLESAIAQPRQAFGGEYLHPDLAAMAAAYLFHIVMDHPFEDGNKRTGTHSALVFLGLNGYDLDPLSDDAEQFICAVAAGKIKKEAVIKYFRALMK